MWCLVMFDLPVMSKQQRREATKFRKLLVDMGYSMVQYSVYARYTPTQSGNRTTVEAVKRHLPAGGVVRILHVTDNQWSSAERFSSRRRQYDNETPGTGVVF